MSHEPSVSPGPGETLGESRPKPSIVSSIAPVLLVSFAWALILRKFQEGNVYELLGPFSLVVLVLVFGKRPGNIKTVLRPTWFGVAMGLATGVGMTILVYPCYWLARTWLPSLEPEVQLLYRGASWGFSPTDVVWLWVVVLAEEVLWRGKSYRAFGKHLSPVAAGALSVALYAAAQLGAGSWIVALLALTCGTIWMALRIYTRGLLAPLLSHLVFTTAVIISFPVI